MLGIISKFLGAVHIFGMGEAVHFKFGTQWLCRRTLSNKNYH